METNTPPLTPRWAARFFTIWTGQAFSLLGSQLVSFAVIWWLTQSTGSATVLATASLVGIIPQVLISPLAGAYVDRQNRRMVMIVADSIIALATLFLAGLFALGWAQIWHIYVLMFLRSTAGGFHWPAMQASTSLMVPKEQLSRIQGLNQVLQGGLSIVSAPLGALLLAAMPLQGILMIDVGTALLAIIPLFFFSIPQPQINGPDGAKGSVWEDFRVGLKYAFGWPGLVMIGAMATVINFLLNPAFALLPILVSKYFNGQAIHLAVMESTLGVGVILGGLTLGIWGGFKRRIYTSMAGLVVMGAGFIVIGLTPSSMFSLAVAAIFLAGFANPITNGPLLASVQAVVAPEMQGRVFTLINSFASAMSPIGLLIAGPLADRVGSSTWFIVGGVACTVMGIIGCFIPAIVHFEDGRPDTPEAQAPVRASIAMQPTDGD